MINTKLVANYQNWLIVFAMFYIGAFIFGLTFKTAKGIFHGRND